jgi:septum formation protein
MPSEVDETMDPEETPDGYVRRVAQQKAEAVAVSVPGRPILGADTIVVIDNQVLGKPGDEEDARRMLRLLSGREHVVMTGVCLLRAHGESPRSQIVVARTLVEFAPISDSEIRWYIDSGEPWDKAGAYAVQGLASRFVARIEGSYSNVVGLPVADVYAMCTRAGILVS